MSVSFKTAALKFIYDPRTHYLDEWKTAVQILYMAHAISRGRKPTSTKGGVNIHNWWRDQEKPNIFYYDSEGHVCSVVNNLYEYSNNRRDKRHYVVLMQAILLCREYFYPICCPKVKPTQKDKEQQHEECFDRKDGRHGYYDEFFQYHNYDDDQHCHNFDDEMIL